MKIVIIIPTLSMGGAERVAVSLSNWIATHKEDEIHLINMGKNTHNFEFNKNLKVYHKNYDTDSIKGFKSIRLIKKLRLKIKYIINILNDIKPDVIFEMLYYPIFFIIPYKFKNKNTIIIGSERNNPKAKGVTLQKKILAKIIPLICDAYIFQTETVRKMFNKKIQKKSIVIPNSVSNPYIDNVDIKSEKEKVISNMGRLHYQKGQDILINAFKIVNEKYPEYKLIIYGEGEEREDLESLISYLKLDDKVMLAGKDSHAIEKVAKSEIFVFTSRYEGMPNALLEAMACGLPCISTDCIAGPSEIIENNKNGILVEVDNVDEIAEKIIYIIENKDIANELGKNARKVKEDYSIDNIFNKYYNFIKEVYEKRGIK